jgi:uncharacterized membrane protein YoaK (UPF0700 family)
MDMSKSLTNNELKLLGLPRPTAGVLIGIGLFLLLVIIFWITKFTVGFIILISPGLFTRFMMSPWFEIINIPLVQNIAPISTILVISTLPPAVLGLLLASKDKAERKSGIILLVLYLIILMILGIPMNAILSD